jgi:4-amino-4-deoxy-L-arabinose transferase-like glycosyltransferase
MFRAAILSPKLKSAIRNHVLLFAGCVLFHIAGTWSLPLVDRDEPRFAEASREMIERGDYVVPYFNNQLRLDKPPLTYWAQVASYRIFSENDFAARFPSAVAAALIAVSIPVRGLRVGSERVGWRAAIIFTLCLQTFLHAKAAVADMWLALFVSIAYWSGLELLRDGLTNSGHQTSNSPQDESVRLADLTPQGSFWWFLFYISLALGFLAKGPIAWAPLLTVASTIFYAPDLQLGRRFKFVRGILLMLAIIAAWGIPALIQTHGEFFRIGIGRHVIGRSFGAMEGHGWNSFGGYLVLLPFYFVTVFVSFFPWSIKLPSLVKKLWRKRDNIDNYLLSGIAIIFIIFSLIKTKLPHYTLPAFGLLALLLARHWPDQAAPLFETRSTTTNNRRSVFGTIAITTACVWLAIALAIPPIVARFFPAYQLFQVSRASLAPNMQFASVEFEEPSLVWYFRSRVRGFLTPLNKRRATEFMSVSRPRFIILPTPVAGMLFENSPQHWKFFSTSGFNIAKGKRVDLTLVLKPD